MKFRSAHLVDMKIPMFSPRPANGFHAGFTLICAAFFCMGVAVTVNSARADTHEELPGIAGAPYPNMPGIPPTGVRIGKHLEVPESAKGPAIDPAKGYRLQELGEGLYMITDNCYQSMFMVYETGVVVIDAPTSYAQHIPKAIAEVTNKPITHIVYSHAAIDHIGGSKSLGGQPIIIAQDETERLLVRANDPNRPIPTITFRDKYTLKVGSQILELSYHGMLTSRVIFSFLRLHKEP